jgi:hypothetical protein
MTRLCKHCGSTSNPIPMAYIKAALPLRNPVLCSASDN